MAAPGGVDSVYNLLQNRPTAPVVLHEATCTPLECVKLRAHADFFVSTAFVRIVGTWVNLREQSNFQFVLPTSGTVTSISVHIGKHRLVETRVISREKANKHKKNNNSSSNQDPRNPQNGNGMGPDSAPSYSEYIPDLFRFPIIGVDRDERIRVDVQYLEPLSYYDQHYHFRLPLTFPQYSLRSNKPLGDVVKVTATVHTITDGVSVVSNSHDLKQEVKLPQLLLTVAEAHEQNVHQSQPLSTGRDFELAYTLAEKDIQGILLKSSSSRAAKSPSPKRRLGNFLQGKRDDKKADVGPEPGFEDIEAAAVDVAIDVAENSELDSVDVHVPDAQGEVEMSPKGAGAEGAKKEDAAVASTPSVDKAKSVEKEKKSKKNQDGSFCLFVSPPTQEAVSGYFNRNIIFLLDRSGSMIGDPFDEAVRAVTTAVQSLRPGDRFNCISFDHRQMPFKNELVPATPENIEAAIRWIPFYGPERGGTDIQTPLEEALTTLESIGNEGDTCVNFVVVITDGCVAEERTICRTAANNCKNTRVLTFGIGTYCNWYFLKMLAEIGRGFDDVVVYRENIYKKMTRLLARASVPVLTNIELDMPGLDEVELYPFPIPDLFLNGPLTIAGRFRGQFPSKSIICGSKAQGKQLNIEVPTKTMKNFPVEKVFIKNRLDLLTAKAWFEESKSLEREVVDLSIANSMPCAHTTLVAVEHEVDDNGNVVKKTSRTRKGAFIVGGAFLVGAAAFSFGSLAGTVGNAPTILGDLGADGDCCGDCGDCDCGDCADCLVC